MDGYEYKRRDFLKKLGLIASATVLTASGAVKLTEIIEDKIKRLSEDVALIHQYKDTNKLYTNYNDLYPQIFFQTFTVEDFLCNPQKLKQKGIDRDVINSLQKILEKF